MQVKIVPNQLRSGVGKRPARENRRAWLPQQARFCPVLEDASKLGFLVYPPLHDQESFQVRLMDNNALRFTFFVGDEHGMRGAVFALDITPSAGTGGLNQPEIVFMEEKADIDAHLANEMFAALTTNVNGPPGAIGLRGAFDFITPPGWDTVYSGILNEQQRPQVPVLTARVETDWYPQPTEFRYVLERGDVISAIGSAPIGQVLFVPREDVRLGDATDEEREWFATEQRAYWNERAKKEKTTNFGTTYTYHYRDLQKQHRAEDGAFVLQQPGDAADRRE